MYIVFNRPIKLNNEFGYRVTKHGDNLGISACWCRELVVCKMQNLLSDLSIEELTDVTATVFGICSHEYDTSYQKSGWKKEYTENAELDEKMALWFKYTALLADHVSLGHAQTYNLTLKSTVDDLGGIGMWNNDPPECVQSLVGEIGSERTAGRGGFYGIPASLLKSPPILSLLLYLPRLCESLNRDRARLWKLRGLSSNCNYRYRFPRAFETILLQFAIPTSFTEFGRAEFWTMYYLMSRPSEDSRWLFDKKVNNRSGFCSGIRTLFKLASFPEKVKKFYRSYMDCGFHTLVTTKRITY